MPLHKEQVTFLHLTGRIGETPLLSWRCSTWNTPACFVLLFHVEHPALALQTSP